MEKGSYRNGEAKDGSVRSAHTSPQNSFLYNKSMFNAILTLLTPRLQK